jgi:hypothetical protein
VFLFLVVKKKIEIGLGVKINRTDNKTWPRSKPDQTPMATRRCIGLRRSSARPVLQIETVMEDDIEDDKDSIYLRIKLYSLSDLGLMSRLYHPSSKADPELDSVTAFAYIMSALTTHQGLFGSAIAFDVIHCQDQETCIKLHKLYSHPLCFCSEW